MFELPGSAPVAAAQGIVVALFLLSFGYLVADALVGRRVAGIVTWGLAFPGLAAFGLTMTGVHVVSGGAIFRSAWLKRGLVLGIYAALCWPSASAWMQSLRAG